MTSSFPSAEVREQLAEEWIENIPLIQKENAEVWRAYFEGVRSSDGKDKLAGLQLPAFESDPTHTTGSQNR